MKTLLSDLQISIADACRRADKKGVFRVTIEKEEVTSKGPSMFVAVLNTNKPNEMRWMVKQMTLEAVKLHWDEIIDTAIDAVLTSGKIVSNPKTIVRIVPGDRQLLTKYQYKSW